MATKISRLKLTPTAVDTDCVCASQSPAEDPILINGILASGGVATLGNGAHLIRLTSGGDDSGITFTFTGTDADGNAQSQTVAGTSGSNTDTTLHFKTITGITASGAVAGTILVGNLAECVSPSYFPDTNINPFNVGIEAVLVSGTATYGLQHTISDFSTYPAVSSWINHATIASASATALGSLLFPVTAFRLKATASSSGVLQCNFLQAGA